MCVCVCRQYQWIDERGKKCKCTAPQYVDYVMTYSQKCVSDEAVFPTKYGNVIDRPCIHAFLQLLLLSQDICIAPFREDSPLEHSEWHVLTRDHTV